MKKIAISLFVLVLTVSFALPCSAGEDFFMQILKEGLVGAGAGAVGGAASGAMGRDIWKGALAGAGVNIVGGALLDSITNQTTYQTQRSYRVQPQQYYYTAQPQTYTVQIQSSPVYASQPSYNTGSTYEEGYQAGYYAGYKAGYTAGFKDGVREAQ